MYSFQDTHLLIDNSNTRTKFALAHTGELLSWRESIPTKEVSAEKLQALLESHSIQRATLCSVVPSVAETTIKTLSELNIPVHRITNQSKLPFQIDYPKPNEIGADRLANSAAVYALGQPVIVIDFGTAVTFDVVSTSNSSDTNSAAYLGGVIAPGLASLKDYLAENTALLPHIELEEPESTIGKSTTQAMQVGAVVGYRGLIREIIAELSQELPSPPHIVATGGDAALIAQKLPLIAEVLPDLTLQGILNIGLLNQELTTDNE